MPGQLASYVVNTVSNNSGPCPWCLALCAPCRWSKAGQQAHMTEAVARHSMQATALAGGSRKPFCQ